MKIPVIDEQGFYVGVGEAAPGDIPNSWISPKETPSCFPPDIPYGKRACWNGAEWRIMDAPSASDLREQAYQAEADEFLKQAEIYEAKEKGFRYLEDLTNAAIAEAKARDFYKQYAIKTLEIRQRFPDQPFYLLNSTGTYHAEGCTHISESAERLTLDRIAAKGNVKPCSRCDAPAFTELENE